MTTEILLVFAVLAATILLFLIDKIRMDVVALMVVVSLALSGIITPAEAVSGFGQPIVVMIAALFVVGEALFRTGVSAAVGQWLLRVGGNSEVRLLLFLLPAVAGLSAFMSSTGAVALFIPVVLSLSRKARLNPSRLLMPLAFAALIGGMLTLIGTPPNIVVSGELQRAGLAPFSFFDFTPLGGLILLIGMAYLIFVARHLLPESNILDPDNPHPNLKAFAERYGISDHLHRLYLPANCTLIKKSIAETELRSRYEVTVFAIQRRRHLIPTLIPALTQTVLNSNDALMVYGTADCISRLCDETGALDTGFPVEQTERLQQEFGVAEVLLRAGSHMTGKTIQEGRFRERFNLSVIGIRRNGEPLLTKFNGTPLVYGDTLLLAGGWRHLEALEKQRDFVILETPAEMIGAPSHAEKAPLALGIMALMLIAMVSGTLPNLSAIMLAALAMILTGCVSVEESYRSLNATCLILIAGMLPLALAMKKSGALNLVVDQLIAFLGHGNPLILCAGLFLLTSMLSQFISNTATTVLLAPIALSAAQGVNLNPEPFMMTVAIAASTAFATPIASPVNTLVITPGNYRFIDFVKVGVPLQMLALLATLVFTPLIFPF